MEFHKSYHTLQDLESMPQGSGGLVAPAVASTASRMPRSSDGTSRLLKNFLKYKGWSLNVF